MVDDSRLKGLLVLGFLAHLVATVVAATTPATGYELSIFGSTPTAYWVGVGQALAVALIVGLYGERRLRDGAILLAALSGLSVAALPVVRGYHFQGAADSLTHLGFARLMGTGAMSPVDLLYPGSHVVALFVSAAGGVDLPLAIQYMVLLFVAVYLAFVPLAVRGIANHGVAVVAGVFAALLFLPINQIGTHPVAHPTSQAVLFLPFVLYLAFNYLTSGDDGRRALSVTAIGTLLGLSLLAIVFIHPQEALDVLLVLGAIAAVQFVVRRRRPSHPIAAHRPMYAHTLFLLVVFLLWTSRHEVVRRWIGRTVTSVLAGGAGAAEVATRVSVLPQVGGSIEELFLKLFLVGLVFSAAAGLLLLASVGGRLDDVFPHRNALVKYLAAALVPLFAVFAVVFAADLGDHYFRFLGAIMVFVTVLGAVAFAAGIPHLVDRGTTGTARRLAVLSFLVLLPLAMATVHPSPYIYQPSSQVTEMEVTGYEAALEHRDPAVEFLSIRDSAPRYVDAIVGPEQPVTGEFDGVDETAFRGDLLRADDEARYLSVTERDLEREVVLYGGFRYPREGFQSLESRPGIDKVQTNGDFRLYLLDGDAAG